MKQRAEGSTSLSPTAIPTYTILSPQAGLGIWPRYTLCPLFAGQNGCLAQTLRKSLSGFPG